ncbi:hypothetical protein MW887_011957 [Aspergillus wentii]|nr:hypothetical protein MW887_011957 [Aspergillus wentii]
MAYLDLTTLDTSTTAVILQIQMEELEHLHATSKGKARVDEPTDSEIALQLYMEDLKRCNTIMADRAMCRSMAAAVVSDGRVLGQCDALERRETRDHEMARQMGGLEAFTEDVPVSGEEVTDDTLLKMQHLYVSPVDEDGGEGSSEGVGKAKKGSAQPAAAAPNSAIDAAKHGNPVPAINGMSIVFLLAPTRSSTDAMQTIANLARYSWK